MRLTKQKHLLILEKNWVRKFIPMHTKHKKYIVPPKFLCLSKKMLKINSLFVSSLCQHSLNNVLYLHLRKLCHGMCMMGQIICRPTYIGKGRMILSSGLYGCNGGFVWMFIAWLILIFCEKNFAWRVFYKQLYLIPS